ncbi:type II toxin-antitoxin system ParD family antitoxin [Plantibacter sp. Mn2098]|uniref:type II toxin-antitoxin system ParD family antitoxin n=1 Tax=Plantibacter sp. Mn2098 TaxID=3395266 RepID=UPI003BE92E58
MATMNISLPDALKQFVESQVGEHYGNSSEFIRDLIRREQARTQLRALVVEGISSGDGSELDHDYFDGLRDRIRSASSTNA